MPARNIGTIKYQTILSIQFIMFNKFYQSIFTNCDNYINSTAADSVHVDAITGTASVLYKDGSIYRYENVSRRAIIKFILDPARSLGKFINVVLKQSRVDAEYRQSMPTYVLG
jgi:hypothetical protein